MSSNRNQNDMNQWYEKVTKINFTIKNEYQRILNVASPPPPQKKPRKNKQTKIKTQREREECRWESKLVRSLFLNYM